MNTDFDYVDGLSSILGSSGSNQDLGSISDASGDPAAPLPSVTLEDKQLQPNEANSNPLSQAASTSHLL